MTSVVALSFHAVVALALPVLGDLHAEERAAPPARTVWMELGTTAGDAAGDGAAGGREAPAAAPPSRAQPLTERVTPHLRTARRESAPQETAPTEVANAFEADSSSAAEGTVGAEEAGLVGGDSHGSGSAAVMGSGTGAGTGQQGSPTGARLLVAGDPCAGYFPADSRVARAQVRLAVEVDERGEVIGSEVLSVNPRDEAFAQAARACAMRMRFAAAKASDGQPVRSRASLELSFERPAD